MTLGAARWHVIAESNFAWEREALDWLRAHLPDRDPWHVWTNFEFIDDQGKVCEVDALVLSGAGLFVVEIKSRPGTLAGDVHTWTWTTDGRVLTTANPLILADRKAKRLGTFQQGRPGTPDDAGIVRAAGRGRRLPGLGRAARLDRHHPPLRAHLHRGRRVQPGGPCGAGAAGAAGVRCARRHRTPRHPQGKDYKETELGPALVFEHDPDAVRLDHLVRDHGARLTLTQRLTNWQTASRNASGSGPSDTPGAPDSLHHTTGPRHVEDYVEDPSLVYLAPVPAGQWPTLGETAAAGEVARSTLTTALLKARERWLKTPAFTEVRTQLDTLLVRQGEVMSAQEAALALLSLRGAGRHRAPAAGHGGVAGGAPLIARAAAWVDYARQLGAAADACAAADPLLPPAVLPAGRLLRLAASASRRAAQPDRLLEEAGAPLHWDATAAQHDGGGGRSEPVRGGDRAVPAAARDALGRQGVG